jgi:hypothetical protein
MSDLPSNEAEAIKADIEQTRAELASTADALAAKLDVKAQAGRKAQAARARVSTTYRSARRSVTEPVQQAWNKAAVSPVAAKAAEDKRRTAVMVAAAVVLTATALIVHRVTR